MYCNSGISKTWSKAQGFGRIFFASGFLFYLV